MSVFGDDVVEDVGVTGVLVELEERVEVEFGDPCWSGVVPVVPGVDEVVGDGVDVAGFVDGALASAASVAAGAAFGAVAPLDQIVAFEGVQAPFAHADCWP